ncbi:alpha/beta hydrolase [Bifidobacterium pseudolongum]|uniref:PGAP1-like alpha/beta domain-containing protein n=1 Tax=Bifidobacterium pseudolongum TaxID=1694 RepID=UPI001F0E52DF|nr:alpha/beta hydrolase [Bifidobacterium pseudolongum]MCH4849590.1 alpha/beta hydrolase [Bifidobacterium pseudolongum]
MTRQVRSSIYGGAVTVADQAEYQRLHSALNAQSAAMASSASRWTQSACTLAAQRERLVWCPAAMQTAEPSVPMHTDQRARIDAARDASDVMARRCRVLADECTQLADLVARAHSLYAEAEMRNTRIVNRAVRAFAVHHPVATGIAVGTLAVAGGVYGWATEGSFNWAYASKATAWAHEGVVSGIGAACSGPGGRLASLTDLPGQSINDTAAVASPFLSHVGGMVQGTSLRMRQVDSADMAVGGASGIQDALHDLRRLGQANGAGDDGLAYGTIAISQYRRQDGSQAWLVTIPGTDGQKDSPFGWIQNAELMSASAAQRRDADSARLVVQAMHQAGVQPEDSVALIGHSQGGIVAAALASDYADTYRIEHVVTAGSPIANHPISSNTWVTSVEMDDELVAALDGASNPANDHWVTIRGTVTDGDSDGLCTGRAIDDSDGPYRLTHDLKYHEAALGHALDLGSPAVQQHNDHFRGTIAGDYVGTTYWQGRMAHHTPGED